MRTLKYPSKIHWLWKKTQNKFNICKLNVKSDIYIYAYMYMHMHTCILCIALDVKSELNQFSDHWIM